MASDMMDICRKVLASLAEIPGGCLPWEQLRDRTGVTEQPYRHAIRYLLDVGAVLAEGEGDGSGRGPCLRISEKGRYLQRNMRGTAIADRAEEAKLAIQAVGSPYGFTRQDWERVSNRRRDSDSLHVVLGYQFTSSHYYSRKLQRSIRSHFQRAIARLNRVCGSSTNLSFKSLSAGLGEHLFNRIAAEIIGADVAVFETSDLNANVMLEMGVALTWGVAVIPVKRLGCPKPPSDISGQTWVNYQDSGCGIVDSDGNTDSTFPHNLDDLVRRKLDQKKALHRLGI